MNCRNLFLILSFLFLPFLLESKDLIEYPFVDEPIDVVIPSTYKDLEILEKCIEGIKKNCKEIRRIIVVSPKKLTDKAEWYDEKLYPFSKYEVALNLCGEDPARAFLFASTPYWGGWYYQQLLKLYAPQVIPGISSNVLLLDSDTVFLKRVKFLNKQHAGLYNPGTEYHPSYFVHAAKLVPGLKKLYKKHSGISHHMLVQKCVLDDLFKTVEDHHQKPFWKAFCQCVDTFNLKTQGASEYEIYFNFLFSRSSQPTIRTLKFANVNTIKPLKKYKKNGFHYVSCHSTIRKK